MAKRRLEVRRGSLSDESEERKNTEETRVSLQSLRARARAAVAKLTATPEPQLCDSFDADVLGVSHPWILNQTTAQWVELLNSYNTETKAYNLSFVQLGELASASRILYVFFQDKDFNNWKLCAQGRVSGKLKYNFVAAYLNKRRHPNFEEPVYGGLIAYLNLFGLGHCVECGMFPNFSVNTLEKDDYVTVSPFRQMTAVEAAAFTGYDDSKLYDRLDRSPKPQHLMNLLIIRDSMKGVPYCCVNCKKPLNKSICGFPASAIPEACNSRSNGRAKHLCTDLENELVTPSRTVTKDHVLVTTPPQKTIVDGEVVMLPEVRSYQDGVKVVVKGTVIRQMFAICIRCGILKLQGEEDDNDACKHCEGDDEGNCCCEACPLCQRMPSRCKCVVCDREECMKCKKEDCSKRCLADPCVCDLSSESSSSESSSSEDSSSSGF
jgi:hypothetical protein